MILTPLELAQLRLQALQIAYANRSILDRALGDTETRFADAFVRWALSEFDPEPSPSTGEYSQRADLARRIIA